MKYPNNEFIPPVSSFDKNEPEQQEQENPIKGEFTLVHPEAEIGEGTQIWNFVHIRENVKIGKNCKIGDYCYIDKDVEIGDNVKIQNRCDIFKGVRIEDNVFIGPNVTFTNVRKPIAGHTVPVSAYTETYIREGTSIGANCTIICGADIQANIAAGCTVLGNQFIREDLRKWIHGYPIKHYPRNKVT